MKLNNIYDAAVYHVVWLIGGAFERCEVLFVRASLYLNAGAEGTFILKGSDHRNHGSPMRVGSKSYEHR